MNEIECETCIKRKTMYCLNSSECFETEDKPHYQNRTMLLEENQQLKEKEELHLNCIDELTDRVVDLKSVIEEVRKIIDEYAMTYDYTSLECKDLADVFTKIKETLQGKKGE